eukprot:8276141-Lingulodinium_polyedra.AAC.1
MAVLRDHRQRHIFGTSPDCQRGAAKRGPQHVQGIRGKLATSGHDGRAFALGPVDGQPESPKSPV